LIADGTIVQPLSMPLPPPKYISFPNAPGQESRQYQTQSKGEGERRREKEREKEREGERERGRERECENRDK